VRAAAGSRKCLAGVVQVRAQFQLLPGLPALTDPQPRPGHYSLAATISTRVDGWPSDLAKSGLRHMDARALQACSGLCCGGRRVLGGLLQYGHKPLTHKATMLESSA
jgi:hypothetical protein